jgi:sugar lactone lactonase YvrE
MMNVVRLETLHYRPAILGRRRKRGPRRPGGVGIGLLRRPSLWNFDATDVHLTAQGPKAHLRLTNMIIPEIELVVDAKALIGESPLWCGDQGVLYWIDVKAPALYRTDIATLVTTSWQLPSDIGGYALKSDAAGAFLGLRTGIFALDFTTGELLKVCDAPFDPLLHRFNEGDCDPSGRLWLGTMFDPKPQAHCAPIKGNLFSFTTGSGLVAHDNLSLLHNGFAWNRKGSQFLLAHSREGRIYSCEFDIERGELGRNRVFAEVSKDLGVPDGGAFDEQGFYWSAIHRGGRLHRYAPGGQLDRAIELPVQNPTMMAFCGPELRDLYFTSATHGKPSGPYEGGIFRVRLDVAGLGRPTSVR